MFYSGFNRLEIFLYKTVKSRNKFNRTKTFKSTWSILEGFFSIPQVNFLESTVITTYVYCNVLGELTLNIHNTQHSTGLLNIPILLAKPIKPLQSLRIFCVPQSKSTVDSYPPPIHQLNLTYLEYSASLIYNCSRVN